MTQSPEYKVHQEASRLIGPRLEQELRDAFPSASKDLTVAYGAGIDRDKNLSMTFMIQVSRSTSTRLRDQLVSHAREKIAEWQPALKTEVTCPKPGRFD